MTKAEWKKLYNREYNKKKYREDAEFRQRQLDRSKKRRQEDPEYRKKENQRAQRRNAKKYKEDPDYRYRVRLLDRLKKYKITEKQLNDMYAKQNGRCAICGEPKALFGRDGLCVDHDHETGKVRGLLCSFCNRVIMPQIDKGVDLSKIVINALIYKAKHL